MSNPMGNPRGGGRGVTGVGWMRDMPPVGFGVVAPQMAAMVPGIVPHPIQTQPAMALWHQQQMMLARQQMTGSGVGTDAQKQQWWEAQHRAAEEQRKMREKLMKQRQFEEQKQKLKAFGSSRPGVNADSMIESILSKSHTAPNRSPATIKKNTVQPEQVSIGPQVAMQLIDMPGAQTGSVGMTGAGVGKSSGDKNAVHNVGPQNQMHGQVAPPQVFPVPPDISQQHLQHQQHLQQQHQQHLQQQQHQVHLQQHMQQQLPVHPQQQSQHLGSTATFRGNTVPVEGSDTQNIKPGSAGQLGTAPANGTRGAGGNRSIVLPNWLEDLSLTPEVYLKATGLVENNNEVVGGGTVDTSRTYMLLMKTGVPAPVLGVMWEMVNRSHPGQLTKKEFGGLLALVALFQGGHSFNSPDILQTLTEPVQPVIDHPALLPLVQDYLKQQQEQQLQQQQQQQQSLGGDVQVQHQEQDHQYQQQQQPFNLTTFGASSGSGPETSPSNTQVSDDDFDDFVSAPTTPPQSLNYNDGTSPEASLVTNSLSQSALLAPVASVVSSLANSLGIQGMAQKANGHEELSAESKARMNLPRVGCSPDTSPSGSFDHQVPDADDDFADFQVATLPAQQSKSVSGVPSVTPPVFPAQAQAKQTNVWSTTDLNNTGTSSCSNSGDKYAAFREFAEIDSVATGSELSGFTSGIAGNSVTESKKDDDDDDFGDFLTSEPASLTVDAMPSEEFTDFQSSFPIPEKTTSKSPPQPPLQSVQPPTVVPNYADLHEALKEAEKEQKQLEEGWSSDPFGEFVEPPPLPVSTLPPPSTSTYAPSSSLQLQPPPPMVKKSEDPNDDDFGDFIGPAGDGDNISLPRLSETMFGETQSVASLELPGLEMTVGAAVGDTKEWRQSPDTFQQTESSGLEDQLSSLNLSSVPSLTMTPSIAGSASIASIPVAGSTPSTCTFDVLTNSLSDKYSSIRQETSKAVCKEDHIGSWERCVESCLALLREASVILSNIENPTVLTQALETGQMKEYLISVEQVWGVCERIQTASQQATTSSRVEEMLTEASEMWKQITEQTGGNSKDTPQELDRKDESEGVEGEGKVCSVCLTEGGHKLSYGGHCYHPPCANLWLNCVDLILPTLTPVTLL